MPSSALLRHPPRDSLPMTTRLKQHLGELMGLVMSGGTFTASLAAAEQVLRIVLLLLGCLSALLTIRSLMRKERLAKQENDS